MIEITLNRQDYEYDVHSLVKAFYPETPVTIRPEGEEAELTIQIDYREEDIHILFFRLPEEILQEEQTQIEDWGNRREVKNRLKTLLYHMLVRQTGKELPWGDLTGIRPVKLAMEALQKGADDEEICSFLSGTYFVSQEKAALATMIARKEKKLMEPFSRGGGYSLYVGIPFCPSICLYCSFSSSPIGLWQDRVEEYLAALLHEMEESAAMLPPKAPDTVYIGGGTPTTLTPGQLGRLLSSLEKHFSTSHSREFTVEAGRPDSIDREKLRVLREHGISRISVNPQTMNQETLDLIGRRHTVEQTVEAFHLAREEGFDNINMDLIIGLPGEGPEETAHTMREIMALGPDSVTVHSLALKRGTRLHLMEDIYRKISFTNSEEIMEMTRKSCMERGLMPYYLYRQKNMAGNFENVGYALEGKECLYNILIMEEVQSIVALGAGGSTKMVRGNGLIERVENVKDIRSYLERIDEMIERKRGFVRVTG